MDEKKRDTKSGQSVGTELQFDRTDMDMIKPGDTLCGIGCFKPSCLQPLAHMFAFVPTSSIGLIASFAFGIYLMSQVTTLEKQFGLTSIESGLMLGASDVGFMVTILIWSHFAKKTHRPRFLALASFIFGASGLLSIIPHFLMVSEAGDMYETTETSSAGDFDRRRLCLARNETVLDDPYQISEKAAGIRRIAFSILFVAFGIQGMAKSPRAPLTQTYVDDNVPKTQTGNYMGFMIIMSVLGPVLGSVVGGLFSTIYVTLEETSLTTRDPRWIGAWWLGLLLFSSVSIVVSIPMSLFPRRMPNAPIGQPPHPETTRIGQDVEESIAEGKDLDLKKEFPINRKESLTLRKTKMERFVLLVKLFFTSLLRIACNPLYVLLSLCDSVMFLTVAGRATFYPKYLEQYFRTSTGTSNFILGLSMMLPGGLGAATGGFLTHRLGLTVRGCMVLRWVTDGLCVILMFLAMAITCDQPIIYGLSNPNELLKLVSPDVTNLTCDARCLCEDQDFLPSCGSDNRTYFSPCHAGCNNTLPNKDFGECACVSASVSFQQTVTPGYCEAQCSSLVIYIVISVVGSFIAGLNGVPTGLTQLRSVQERDRSMSIGLNGLLRSILGFFLGPIVFGLVVDTSCILWSARGSCSLYDIDDLRIKLHVFTGGVLGAVAIINVIAVLMTYKMERYCKIAEWQRQAFTRERELAKTMRREKNDTTNMNGDANVSETKDGVTTRSSHDQKDTGFVHL